MAIGAIIEAEQKLEIRTENEVLTLVETIIETFFDPFPTFVVTFLQETFPDFFRALSVYIAFVIYNYLNMLPGDVLDFASGPEEKEFIQITTREDLLERIEHLNSTIDSKNKTIKNLRTSRDRKILQIKRAHKQANRYLNMLKNKAKNSTGAANVRWADRYNAVRSVLRYFDRV